MKSNIRRFLLFVSVVGYCVGINSIFTYAQAKPSRGKPPVPAKPSAGVPSGRQPDGQAQSGRQSQDELSKLVDECLRFLDATLARGISEAQMREDLWPGGWGLGGHQNADDLRRDVRLSKERITHAAAAARRDGRPIPSEWNRTLRECIDAYVMAIYELNGIESEKSDLIIQAGALGLTPQRLREIVAIAEGGDTEWFVVQDEKAKFDRAHEPYRRELEAKLDVCNRSNDSKVCLDCITPAYRAYLAAVAGPLQAFMNAVMANASKAESGFAPAAAKYANRWIPVLKDGENYINRAVAAMKPVRLDSSNAQLYMEYPTVLTTLIMTGSEFSGGQAEHTFNFYMDLLYEMVKADISSAQGHLANAKAAGPGIVFHARPDWKDCGTEEKANLSPPQEITVDTGWDQLKAALSGLRKVSVLTRQPEGKQDSTPGNTIIIRKNK